MKKIYIVAAIAFANSFIYGQSQRLVFLEEFTQASCGPCASANPTYNALVNGNPKAVSIKYQTDWPGVDPMNAQNPQDIKTRVTYYGVSGVPNAFNDGKDMGNPGTETAATINAEYAVPSPFSIKLDHWFNTANDSIFINCEITCSQNVVMTSPRVRIAMVEKTITFSTAPGSNGEKDFYNVVRKMYPNALGSPAATNWTVGQKKTLSFKAKIPTYIYSKPQIAVVAWIQDDSDKNVKQSGFSSVAGPALALPPVPDFTSDLVTTACDGIINFQDQSALFPTSWLWDFGDGTTSTQANPTHKYNTAGNYTVKLTAGNSNGNNVLTKTSYITVNLTGAAPTGKNKNRCGPGVVNLSALPAGSGTLNWYNMAGQLVNTGNSYSPNITTTTNFFVAEMTPNTVKTEGASSSSIGAVGTYTAAATQGLVFDVLQGCKLVSVDVEASTAGTRTIQILDGGGAVIQTTVVNIPSGKSTVNLNFSLNPGGGYVIQPSFACNLSRNTAGGAYPYNTSGVVNITGNTVGGTSAAYYYFFYNWKVLQNPCTSVGTVVSGIDSCAIATGIMVNTSTLNSLNVYPNPNEGSFNANFQTDIKDNYTIKITNMLGQAVYEESLPSFSGVYSKQIDIAIYGKGIYMFRASNSKNEVVRKLVIQ